MITRGLFKGYKKLAWEDSRNIRNLPDARLNMKRQIENWLTQIMQMSTYTLHLKPAVICWDLSQDYTQDEWKLSSWEVEPVSHQKMQIEPATSTYSHRSWLNMIMRSNV